MNKLISYAISPKAWELLFPAHRAQSAANTPQPAACFKECFNWRIPSDSSCGSASIQRIFRVPEAASHMEEMESILNWVQRADEAGVDVTLVFAQGDAANYAALIESDSNQKTLPSLLPYPDVAQMLLHSQPAGQADIHAFCAELLAPEEDMVLAFTAFRGGGAMALARHGCKALKPAHWWHWGCAFADWVKKEKQRLATNKEQRGIGAYPLHQWDVNSRFNEGLKDGCIGLKQLQAQYAEQLGEEYPQCKLDAFQNGGSLEKPWTEDDIPGLKAHKAVYAIPDLPYCGVAVTEKGNLEPWGGFAGLDDKWRWAWDYGSSGDQPGEIGQFIKTKTAKTEVSSSQAQALAPANASAESLMNKNNIYEILKNFINDIEDLILIAPSYSPALQAGAGNSIKRATLESQDGLLLTIEHTFSNVIVYDNRSKGKQWDRYWLICAKPNAEHPILGCWKLPGTGNTSVHEIPLRSGTSDSLIFILSKTPAGE